MVAQCEPPSSRQYYYNYRNHTHSHTNTYTNTLTITTIIKTKPSRDNSPIQKNKAPFLCRRDCSNKKNPLLTNAFKPTHTKNHLHYQTIQQVNKRLSTKWTTIIKNKKNNNNYYARNKQTNKQNKRKKIDAKTATTRNNNQQPQASVLFV